MSWSIFLIVVIFRTRITRLPFPPERSPPPANTSVHATAVLLLFKSRTREVLVARPSLRRVPRREQHAGEGYGRKTVLWQNQLNTRKGFVQLAFRCTLTHGLTLTLSISNIKTRTTTTKIRWRSSSFSSSSSSYRGRRLCRRRPSSCPPSSPPPRCRANIPPHEYPA